MFSYNCRIFDDSISLIASLEESEKNYEEQLFSISAWMFWFFVELVLALGGNAMHIWEYFLYHLYIAVSTFPACSWLPNIIGTISWFVPMKFVVNSFNTYLGSQQIVPPVLNSFADQDSRVRYYACEALYNIAKVKWPLLSDQKKKTSTIHLFLFMYWGSYFQ